MTTARDLIESALKLNRVLSQGKTMTAAEASDGLETLNQLLHSLKAEGADLGFADIDLNDEIPLPPEHVRAVRFLLAVDLAPEYSVELTPEVSIGAQNAKLILQAAYAQIPELGFDRGLKRRLDDWWGDDNHGS